MADDRITQDDPDYVPFFERANIRPNDLAELRKRLNGAVKSQVVINGDNQVCCPGCGELIGNEINVDEQMWFTIGNFEGYAVHGRCKGCHAEFHWTVNDIRLARLIASRKS